MAFLTDVEHMIDVALHTPEMGVVNFRVLHALLHVLCQRLEILDQKVEIRGQDARNLSNMSALAKVPTLRLTEYIMDEEKPVKPDDKGKATDETVIVVERYRDGDSQTDKSGKKSQASKRTSKTKLGGKTSGEKLPGAEATKRYSVPTISQFKDLETKVDRLWENMHSMPDNETLLADARTTRSKSLMDIWQSMNVSARLTALEVAVEKLTSVMGDLAMEYQTVQDQLAGQQIAADVAGTGGGPGLFGPQPFEQERLSRIMAEPGYALTPGKAALKTPEAPESYPSGIYSSEFDTGARGAPGYAGAPGVTETPGYVGATWQPGATGVPGIPGYAEARIPTGPGVQGAPGYAGTQGLPGAQGYAGEQGIPGVPGIPGAPGAIGVPGFAGYAGAPGFAGAQGFPDMQGYQGAPGIVGVPGISGPGIQGYSGVGGALGVPGTTGYPGAPGYSGVPGYAGGPGAVGYAGQPGILGAPGVSGIQGFPGAYEMPVSDTPGYAVIPGAVGSPGNAGAPGLIGAPGFVGQSGVAGAPGSGLVGKPGPGVPGAPILAGPPGYLGIPGYVGLPGIAGAPLLGPSGMQGVAGALEVDGVPVSPGAPVASSGFGIPGAPGFPGPQAGFPGYQNIQDTAQFSGGAGYIGAPTGPPGVPGSYQTGLPGQPGTLGVIPGIPGVQESPHVGIPGVYPHPGTFPPGTYPPETFPAGTYPPGTFPPGTFPAETYPPGTFPPGSFPPGTLPPGTFPPGTFPPETLPSGTFSPGTLPPGTYSPGNYAIEEYPPESQYPPGVPPPGYPAPETKPLRGPRKRHEKEKGSRLLRPEEVAYQAGQETKERAAEQESVDDILEGQARPMYEGGTSSDKVEDTAEGAPRYRDPRAPMPLPKYLEAQEELPPLAQEAVPSPERQLAPPVYPPSESLYPSIPQGTYQPLQQAALPHETYPGYQAEAPTATFPGVPPPQISEMPIYASPPEGRVDVRPEPVMYPAPQFPPTQEVISRELPQPWPADVPQAPPVVQKIPLPPRQPLSPLPLAPQQIPVTSPVPQYQQPMPIMPPTYIPGAPAPMPQAFPPPDFGQIMYPGAVGGPGGATDRQIPDVLAITDTGMVPPPLYQPAQPPPAMQPGYPEGIEREITRSSSSTMSAISTKGSRPTGRSQELIGRRDSRVSSREQYAKELTDIRKTLAGGLAGGRFSVTKLREDMDKFQTALEVLAKRASLEPLSEKQAPCPDLLKEINLLKLRVEDLTIKARLLDSKIADRVHFVESKIQDNVTQMAQLDTVFNNQMNTFQDQVSDQERYVSELVVRIEKIEGENKAHDISVLRELQAKVSSFQDELENLNDMTHRLNEDREERQMHINALLEQIEILKSMKADRDELEDALADKADQRLLNRKVSHDQFDAACDDLGRGLEETLAKLSLQEAVWQHALDELQGEIDNKLDKLELSPLKEFFNAKMRSLQERLKAIALMRRDAEAAGSKAKFLSNVNCISCDSKVIMSKTEDVPGVPQSRPLHPTRSIKPYLSYELDSVRKHRKAPPSQRNMRDWESMNREEVARAPLSAPPTVGTSAEHLCNRYCGGSHTLTTATQRVTRLGHFVKQFGPEVVNLANNASVRGADGKVYKGSGSNPTSHNGKGDGPKQQRSTGFGSKTQTLQTLQLPSISDASKNSH